MHYNQPMPEADLIPVVAPRRRLDQAAMWLGPIAIAGLMTWMSYWTLLDQSHPEIAVVFTPPPIASPTPSAR